MIEPRDVQAERGPTVPRKIGLEAGEGRAERAGKRVDGRVGVSLEGVGIETV